MVRAYGPDVFFSQGCQQMGGMNEKPIQDEVRIKRLLPLAWPASIFVRMPQMRAGWLCGWWREAPAPNVRRRRFIRQNLFVLSFPMRQAPART